jgi:hypothetical protein
MRFLAVAAIIFATAATLAATKPAETQPLPTFGGDGTVRVGTKGFLESVKAIKVLDPKSLLSTYRVRVEFVNPVTGEKSENFSSRELIVRGFPTEKSVAGESFPVNANVIATKTEKYKTATLYVVEPYTQPATKPSTQPSTRNNRPKPPAAK